MKKIALGIIMAALLIGCGSKEKRNFNCRENKFNDSRTDI